MKLAILLALLALLFAFSTPTFGADSLLVKNINEKDFKSEVLDSKLPVLVDFWAPWCGPCRMVGPSIEELAKKYNKEMKFVKINVDNAAALSAKYKITSIPMLAVFKNGKIAEQMVGAYPLPELEKFVLKQLK